MSGKQEMIKISDAYKMMKDGQLIFQGKYEKQNGDLEAFYLSQFEEDAYV